MFFSQQASKGVENYTCEQSEEDRQQIGSLWDLWSAQNSLSSWSWSITLETSSVCTWNLIIGTRLGCFLFGFFKVYIINEVLVSVKKCLPPVIFLIPDDTCFPPSSVNAAHPCSVCLFFNYCINARKPEKYGSSQTPTHTISHVVAHFTFI